MAQYEQFNVLGTAVAGKVVSIYRIWRRTRYTNEADMPCIVTAYMSWTAHKTARHSKRIGFTSPTG